MNTIPANTGPDAQKRSWSRDGIQPRIAIIGAGFSGIGALIKFREHGYTDLTCYEKADRIGGTWRDNRYPGLSCDVPSHWYSYYFEPNPNWTHRFSYGPEILQYMNQVADKHDVKKFIKLNTAVTALDYVGPEWRLTTEKGDVEIYDIVVAATGVLVNPSFPSIKGLDDFTGEMWHSARWRDDVSLKGKRVGIIGTGSTACQIVGAIASDVGHLSVFQRTPHWLAPLPQKKYTKAWKFVLKHTPGLPTLLRKLYRWYIEETFGRATLGDARQQRSVQAQCEAHLRRQVPDPTLRAKLTPNYKAACKRLILCSEFYPALMRENVDLVTDGIEAVEAKGVRTRDGALHELDILVLATGFHAADFILPTTVTGEDGVDLGAFWNGSPRAHRALTFPRFPNFFMLEGPTGVIGNTSLIDVSEHQIAYVVACLNKMRSAQADVMAVKQDAYDAYNAELAKGVGRTVWATGGCDSWYFDASGTPNIYPYAPKQYRSDMLNPRFDEFRLERRGSPETAARSLEQAGAH